MLDFVGNQDRKNKSNGDIKTGLTYPSVRQFFIIFSSG